MTFGMTLAEHLWMAASASMFYIAIDYENELKYESSSQQRKHSPSMELTLSW